MSKEKVCCVCHHKLSCHINEKDVWRCHCLGSDCMQCECALRKNRADSKIKFYDLNKRCKEMVKELRCRDEIY